MWTETDSHRRNYEIDGKVNTVQCRYDAVQFITIDITYRIAMIASERKPGFNIIIDTPYLTLAGELWSDYYEDFEENWPRYNGTALYIVIMLFFFTLHKWYRSGNFKRINVSLGHYDAILCLAGNLGAASEDPRERSAS